MLSKWTCRGYKDFHTVFNSSQGVEAVVKGWQKCISIVFEFPGTTYRNFATASEADGHLTALNAQHLKTVKNDTKSTSKPQRKSDPPPDPLNSRKLEHNPVDTDTSICWTDDSQETTHNDDAMYGTDIVGKPECNSYPDCQIVGLQVPVNEDAFDVNSESCRGVVSDAELSDIESITDISDMDTRSELSEYESASEEIVQCGQQAGTSSTPVTTQDSNDLCDSVLHETTWTEISQLSTNLGGDSGADQSGAGTDDKSSGADLSSDGADGKPGGDARRACGGTYGEPRDVTNEPR